MRTKLPAIFFIAIIFNACSKSNSDLEPINNNADTKIKRIINSFAGTNQADIDEFTYDTDGRLIKWDYRSEDSSATPLITYEEINTFYYNGSDDKPYKDSIVYVYGSSGSFPASIYYTYDSQNKILKYEEFQAGDWVNRHLYEYYGDLLVQKNYYNNAGNIEEKHDSARLDNEGRVYLSKYYVYPAGTLYYTTNITFDTKPSPYSTLNVYKYLYDISANFAQSFELAKNNILTFSTVNNGSTDLYTYVFSYNADNFPVTSNQTYYANGTALYSSVVKYEYY